MVEIAAQATDASADPRGFGKLWPFLRISFGLFIISEIALLISNVAALGYFQKVSIGGYKSDEAALAAGTIVDLHQGITGVVYFVVFVVTIIAYCRFYYRAMNNLSIRNAAGLRTTPFWAVGVFFIPIVNLWKPLTAVRQIWRGSHAPETADIDVPSIIGFWWFFWIVTSLLGNASMRLLSQSGGFGEEIHDLDMYMGSLALDILSAPLSIAAAWLVILFSKRIFIAQNMNIIPSA